MITIKAMLFFLIIATCHLSALFADAAEVKTAFATVHYETKDSLKYFNYKIGCDSDDGVCLNSKHLPEISAGMLISSIVDRIQNILGMKIAGLNFHIHLLSSEKDVQYVYKKIYGKDVNYIAFYSPRKETIYIAIDTLRRTVLTHEITHAIVDRYFKRSPPVKVHELLAQYVEKQL